VNEAAVMLVTIGSAVALFVAWDEIRYKRRSNSRELLQAVARTDREPELVQPLPLEARPTHPGRVRR
jgi:hypothetical protein